jgi:hypothetical protein
MSTVSENQLKIIKYNHLIANLIIFHNCRHYLGVEGVGNQRRATNAGLYSFTKESLRLPSHTVSDDGTLFTLYRCRPFRVLVGFLQGCSHDEAFKRLDGAPHDGHRHGEMSSVRKMEKG